MLTRSFLACAVLFIVSSAAGPSSCTRALSQESCTVERAALMQTRFSSSSSLPVNKGQEAKSSNATLATVPFRMQYWKRWDRFLQDGGQRISLDPHARYLLFDDDLAGLNNIRLGFETAGLIAKATGRVLVLPPAKPFEHIDLGLRQGNRSCLEDFMNLQQLRRGIATLTFEEFLDLQGIALGIPEDILSAPDSFSSREKWRSFASENFRVVHGEAQAECNLQNYEFADHVIYAKLISASDGRLFACTRWWNLGEVDLTIGPRLYQVPVEGRALLHGGFVWHEEVFELAAPIVQDLGMFSYVAVHARFGDFHIQYPNDTEPASAIVDRWFLSALGRRLTDSKTVYISTDDASDKSVNSFRDQGFRVRWSKDYFESPNSPIANMLETKDPARVLQLKGPVEQVVCAFSQIFIGTLHSTFSGYIQRMRLSLDAPEANMLHHTDVPTMEQVQATEGSVQQWQARHGADTWEELTPDTAFLQIGGDAATAHLRNSVFRSGIDDVGALLADEARTGGFQLPQVDAEVVDSNSDVLLPSSPIAS